VPAEGLNTGRSMSSFAGQDVTAVAQPHDEGTILRVGGGLAKGGSPFGGGSQMFAWGELGRVVNRFYDAFEQALPTVDEPTSQQVGGVSAADEIARLAELHEKGALTDAEFSSAKRRLLS
jgi:hypothetical protein